MRSYLLAGLLMMLTASAVTGAPVPSLASLEGVTLAEPPRSITDFALTDQDGKAWSFSRLQGHPALLFFGFAHCPDICPATLFRLRQLQKAAPRELSSIPVVMVSVDGERDTPAVLKTYLAGFSPRFIGVTGAPSLVTGIAARFPAVFFKGIPPAPGAEYSVQHTSDIYLIDARGRVRAQFKDAKVEDMLAVLRSLS